MSGSVSDLVVFFACSVEGDVLVAILPCMSDLTDTSQWTKKEHRH